MPDMHDHLDEMNGGLIPLSWADLQPTRWQVALEWVRVWLLKVLGA